MISPFSRQLGLVRIPMRWLQLVALLACVLPSGCLSRQYLVAPAELARVAAMPPEARGELVAAQRTTFEREVRTGDAQPYGEGYTRTDSGIVVYPRPLRFGGGVFVGRTAGAGSSGAASSGAGRFGAQPTVGGADRTAAQPGVNGNSGGTNGNSGQPGGGSRSSGGSGSGIGDLGGGKGVKDIGVLAAAALVVLPVAIGVGLAVMEGSRFKGTVQIAPDHMIYLRDAAGNLKGSLPLYALEPGHLAPGDDAIIAESQGTITEKTPSPLDRVGMSYTFDLGAGALNRADRAYKPAITSRLGVGYFPHQRFGIYAGVNFTVGEKIGSAITADVRPYLEAQVFPFDAGKLHIGGYGEVGYALGQDEFKGVARSTESLAYGAGLIGQAEISTFLAGSLRAGFMAVTGPAQIMYAPNVTLGIAVY
jgi:hypothetical protein